MDIVNSLALSSPEILLTISGLILLMVCAFVGDKAARIVTILAVAALFGATAITADFLTNPAFELGGDAWAGIYRMDAFGSFSKILIYLAAIGCLIVTPKFFDATGEYRPEYPVLMLFGAVGMGLMVSAVDLMTLYMGLELTSLASYVLASFTRSDDRSAEAGLKYFVLGALASGILLYGMSLVYGFTGSTNYIGIRVALQDGLSTGALFGIVFVLAGMAFKIAAVPFHMWTPDVYEGAPTPVTAFFATAPKVAAIVIMMRIALDPFGGQSDAWQQIVIFAALASIVVGALGAISQDNIKRLLAYSSINNVGFILIGLAAATEAGAAAMLVYLTIYVAMSLGSFVVVMMMRDADGKQVEEISKLGGLSRSQPWLALCMAMMMLSLAGIPPLFGFWGKLVVFQAAVQADMVLLAALGIAASVIGAFYYLKIVKIMYFDEPAGVVAPSHDTARWAVLAVTALIVSPLGYLLIVPLGALASRAAAALFFII
ncbi:NADH-quinone oxidoreductase subunit NuoN [Altererythrobacter sp. RZ02]|uniref:NADH-quinone oxidoreductase subunit N n=1 Tax=Pontixanthobacter rizhaonensis TaxID=2730337 RepID=A0A848QLJ7_9SPHN|nr:NADH-quinone oxidoreductase subunit NuoN [Pontixanthobacter rizhaonensis]NMW31497.1 NADH-quinone oxidoreductase subunit NuoN [Pontixanthobacter rizhaonensis]